MVLGLFFLLPAGHAAEPADNEGGVLNAAVIEVRLKQLAEDPSVADDLRTMLNGLYREALDEFRMTAESKARAKSWRSKLSAAPSALRERRATLTARPEKPDLAPLTEESRIEDLAQNVDVWETKIDDADNGLKKRLKAADAALADRSKRLQELPDEIVAAEEHVEEAQEAAKADPSEDDSTAVQQAKRWLADARLQRYGQELLELEVESAWAKDGNVESLLRVERDLLEHDLNLAEAEYEQWQTRLEERREQETAAQAAVAAAEAMLAHPTLRPLAEQNSDLADEVSQVSDTLSQLRDDIEAAEERLETIEEEFSRTQEMVDAVGFTEAIGLMLRKQRRQLVELRHQSRHSAMRAETIRAVRLKLFNLEAPSSVAPTTTPLTQELQEQSDKLAKRREELVDDLKDLYNEQFTALVDLDHAERKLANEAERYGQFIDERALWVRTGGPISGTQIHNAASALAAVFQTIAEANLVDQLKEDVSQSAAMYAAVLVGLLGGWWMRRRLVHALVTCGDLARQPEPISFWPTSNAFGITVALAVVWPLLLAFLGWRFDHVSLGLGSAQAVSQGLWHAAAFVAPLRLLRWICVRRGLAECHFGWSDEAVRRVGRHVAWFTPVGGFLACVVSAVAVSTNETHRDSIGRLAFLALAVTTGLFCAATLVSPPQVDAAGRTRRSWLGLMRVSAVIAAVTLAALDVLGYYHTAIEIGWRLRDTAWLAVALLIVRATAQRAIQIETNRIRLKQEATQNPATDASAAGRNLSVFARLKFSDWRFDLNRVIEQMQRLLQGAVVAGAVIGAWGIWNEVVPALGILDHWTLWQTLVEQSSAEAGADGKTNIVHARVLRPITAADLSMALLTISLGIVAARNLPGLVEVLLLERLPMDAGVRFAVTAIGQYALFVAAMVMAFGRIGIGWANVQWLVAAASVGLGFGLQEIFANFVSGLILLFERPIRVGDVITIGDTTGTVTRIRFRATTITDWDRKELVVPNKEFVTGKLLNWTLTDQINRIVIRVGVAYGTDPHQARELLTTVMKEHPLVLHEPAPTATFEEFGESALNFTVRCFLQNLDHRSRVTHELHTMIYQKLTAAGITIPVPKRDPQMQAANANPSSLADSILSEVGLHVESPVLPVHRRA